MKVLDQLLQIKEFREDKAQAEVSRARGALTEADSALTRAKTHLDEHRADCDLRERQIYAELCTRQVRLTDLQDVALKVDEFKQSIQGCESRVSEANEHRVAKADCLTQSQQLLQSAVRVRQKFSELREMSSAEELLVQSRAEDAELEEVPTKLVRHDEEEVS